MSLPSSPFWQTRTRRHIALVLAVAVLFAGIAQAAHYHKSELTGSGSTDVHCLLCLYAASTAGPPPLLQLAERPSPCYCGYRYPASLPVPQTRDTASYDARGPPAV